MLDETPENLLKEAQAAEEHNKKHLVAFPDIIQTLVGSYYRDDMRPVNPSPENYPYSYVANVRPRLVFNNPRFNALTESTAIDSHQALAQAKYVNRWAIKENLQKKLNPYVTTALLVRSVMLTTFDDDEKGDGPAEGLKKKTCHCHLLENHRYFRDGVSTPAVEPRFKGHVWVRDLADVRKMKGVNKQAVDGLIPDIELQKLERPNDSHGNTSSMPPRFEVIAYEIWVRECNKYRTGDGRGQHGTIFTVAIGQKITSNGTERFNKAGFLFPPRAYYGPEWGPYTELEYVDVPGQTYGTSPVSVVMQQVEEVNAHLSATADAAARMKHLVLIDAANDVLQVSVQNSPDGSMIGIPGLTKDSVHQVLIGGPAPEQYQYNEIARQRLDRNIGMDASQRGGETVDQTATSSNIQYETLNVRMADLKRITTAAVMQIANTVAWYAWESNNVAMRLSPEDAEDMGIEHQPGMVHDFYGGPQNGEQLPPWDTAALQLVPYSMEAVDEEKLAAEVTESLAIIAQLAQEMQTAPWLDYDVILEQLGKLRKFDWMHECINGQLFAEWMKEQVQQNVEKHQMEQALMQAQIEGTQIDNAKKKAELMAMIQQMSQPAEQKGPSVSISYKDLPEDMKRLAEKEGLGASSTMPLTSPAHIQNALDVHKTNAGMEHEKTMTKGSQQHDRTKQASQQKHEVKQSQLAGMLKNMANRKGSAGGMKTRQHRAGKGPTNTASRGQKAHAGSR